MSELRIKPETTVVEHPLEPVFIDENGNVKPISELSKDDADPNRTS